MRPAELHLDILPHRLAVCRLPPEQPVPAWIDRLPFWSMTRTADELSVVVPEEAASPGWRQETGWRVLKVRGPLEFTLVGVMAQLTVAIAAAGVSLFAMSTFDTDYLLVRDEDLARATAALSRAGCTVSGARG
jgi:uncharacterized protein